MRVERGQALAHAPQQGGSRPLERRMRAQVLPHGHELGDDLARRAGGLLQRRGGAAVQGGRALQCLCLCRRRRRHCACTQRERHERAGRVRVAELRDDAREDLELGEGEVAHGPERHADRAPRELWFIRRVPLGHDHDEHTADACTAGGRLEHTQDAGCEGRVVEHASEVFEQGRFRDGHVAIHVPLEQREEPHVVRHAVGARLAELGCSALLRLTPHLDLGLGRSFGALRAQPLGLRLLELLLSRV
mmetsp:Transcript_7655/g.19520  ORF Transcript_7655/g.19520 Transcript_7655/m.19520 type:complete len:247 (-) Transcript_7655:83-823(-)